MSLLGLWSGLAFGQTNLALPLTYDKADRVEKITSLAKSEGSLTVYTASRPQDLATLLAPFEAKTGIKVKAWRSGSDNVLQRVIRESNSKRAEVDVIMTPAGEMLAMSREHLLQPVYSPHTKDLIASAVVPHQLWSSLFMNVVVQSYNTQAIKKENLPKSFNDLLDPRFKSNLGIESKAEEWFAKVTQSMGEEKGIALFKEIGQKNGFSTRLGVSLLHNLVVAGEVPLALTVYIDLPEKDKKAGKPVDWFALDPVVAQGFNVGVAAKAPHPYSALLFYDYLLSVDTQKLLTTLGYYPTSTKVSNPYPELKINVIDPNYIIDNYAKWTKLFEQNVTKIPKN
jgi:iron(III) transport system substrate-binding protein